MKKTTPTPRGAERRRTPPKVVIPEGPSSDDVRCQIAEAAYFIAEGRGFAPGRELDDWLAAEAQIKTQLGLAGPPN